MGFCPRTFKRQIRPSEVVIAGHHSTSLHLPLFVCFRKYARTVQRSGSRDAGENRFRPPPLSHHGGTRALRIASPNRIPRKPVPSTLGTIPLIHATVHGTPPVTFQWSLRRPERCNAEAEERRRGRSFNGLFVGRSVATRRRKKEEEGEVSMASSSAGALQQLALRILENTAFVKRFSQTPRKTAIGWCEPAEVRKVPENTEVTDIKDVASQSLAHIEPPRFPPPLGGCGDSLDDGVVPPPARLFGDGACTSHHTRRSASPGATPPRDAWEVGA